MRPFRKFLRDFMSSQRLLRGAPLVGRLAEAEAILSRLVGEKQLPGMVVDVRKNGEKYFQKGFGNAHAKSKKVVDPGRTLFRAASASKPIAATALGRMVEAGLIDLDASFYDYAPYFPKKKYDFTIRQLASHTAGIRGYKGKEYALNRPYTIKDSLSIFKEDALLFPPGTSYHYNSYDWVLVSLAMEEASGIPFDEYVRKEVLIPLGMDHTKPEVPRDPDKYIAEFYTKTSSGFRKSTTVDNRYKLAGGGYLTTAADLSILGQSYLTKTFLKPETYVEFLNPLTINGTSTYYGLGWEVSLDKSGNPYFGHTGNSIGGYSNFYIYPENDLVVSILINCTDPKVQAVLDEVILIWLSAEPII
ncbi:MAG: serine hydrolase domain-containing protein [Flavobacteriaceae bacterium]